jgi:hypothetical protein
VDLEDLEPVALRILKGRVHTPILTDDGVTLHTGSLETLTLTRHAIDDEAQLAGISVGTLQQTRIPERLGVEQLDTHVSGAQGSPVHHRDGRGARINVVCLKAQSVSIEPKHRGEVLHKEVHLEEIHLTPFLDQIGDPSAHCPNRYIRRANTT